MATEIADPDLLASARAAIGRRDWNAAFELFTRADASTELNPKDLEDLANVAWFSGKGAIAAEVRERAFHAHVRAGDNVRAAFLAFQLFELYSFRSKGSVAAAWLRRGEQLLQDESEGYAHGYLQLALAKAARARGEVEAAIALAERAEAIGSKTQDSDLRAEALILLGNLRIATGATAEGFAILEEAAAAAVSGELTPYNTGATFCQIISACRDVTDYQRASEWTEETERWCERQAMPGFPGVCRIHRAEVAVIKGGWERAVEELERATAELESYEAIPPMADGFYALGEVKRRRGEFADAEAALRRAEDLGRSPHPSLALIRLAQGKIKAAVQAIGGAVADESWDRWARSRLLPAQVEILIAASDIAGARAAAEEFSQQVATYQSPALRAAEQEAWGRVLLAEGDAAEAARRVRSAIKSWQEVSAPYEIAVDRVLLASALHRQGDDESAADELAGARDSFLRLGAKHDLALVDRMIADAAARQGSSSEIRKTFMFTDIENSTSLAGALGNRAWEQLLGWHDETLRNLFARQHGEVVSSTGDGFFVAFDSASQAVTCAIAIQRALAEHRRTSGFAPAVRIGIHTAAATHRGDDYSGQAVHVAARIAALGKGGEIVVSAETQKEAGDFRTFDEAEAELKGVDFPVQVAHVAWDD